MSNSVNISYATPNTVELETDKNTVTIIQPDGNNQVIVGQSQTKIIEVRAPGLKGDKGDVTNYIATGSITASVNIGPNDLFLIKSGSQTYYQIASNGDTEIYSDLFIIKNRTTQQPVLTISQSIIQFPTQSVSPTGNAVNGGFWFTATDFYVGLD